MDVVMRDCSEVWRLVAAVSMTAINLRHPFECAWWRILGGWSSSLGGHPDWAFIQIRTVQSFE